MRKCTNCNNWNTFVEEEKQPKEQKGIGSAISQKASQPTRIKQIQSEKEPRITIAMQEFNRVLGGGIVPGSLVLIGGDPGIGKSTLLLQTSAQIAAKDLTVLYISGEESMQQTKLRAERLGITTDKLIVLSETKIGRASCRETVKKSGVE